MKNLRYKRKRIIILIIIFIIILTTLYTIAQSKGINFQEDVIFFKLFGNENNISQEKNNNNQYEIKILKNRKTYRQIDLKETIDKKTLVHEKIAPGTKGNFEIILTSENNMNYEIKISDENQRPKNFIFTIEEDKGKIEANETKKIKVDWMWNYETDTENDIEDTKDGESLDKYYFEIYAIGK